MFHVKYSYCMALSYQEVLIIIDCSPKDKQPALLQWRLQRTLDYLALSETLQKP